MDFCLPLYNAVSKVTSSDRQGRVVILIGHPLIDLLFRSDEFPFCQRRSGKSARLVSEKHGFKSHFSYTRTRRYFPNWNVKA